MGMGERYVSLGAFAIDRTEVTVAAYAACVRAGVPPVTSAKVEALRKLPHSFEWLRAPPPGVDKLAAWAAAVKRAVETAAEARRCEGLPVSGGQPHARL